MQHRSSASSAAAASPSSASGRDSTPVVRLTDFSAASFPTLASSSSPRLWLSCISLPNEFWHPEFRHLGASRDNGLETSGISGCNAIACRSAPSSAARVTALAAMASELASGYVTIGRMACGFTARFLPSKEQVRGPHFIYSFRSDVPGAPIRGALSILHKEGRPTAPGQRPRPGIEFVYHAHNQEVRLQRTLLANDVVCGNWTRSSVYAVLRDEASIPG